MSIKSCFQELYIGRQECNIITMFGNKINLKYKDIDFITFRYATSFESGYIDFKTKIGKTKRFDITKKVNEKVSRAINFITENYPDLYIEENDGSKDKFFQSNIIILILLLFCCSPLGIILMLCFKKFTKPIRVCITTIYLILWSISLYNIIYSFNILFNAFNMF